MGGTSAGVLLLAQEEDDLVQEEYLLLAQGEDDLIAQGAAS